MSLKSEFLSHLSHLWCLQGIFQSLLTSILSVPGLSIFLSFCGDRLCSHSNFIPVTYILISAVDVSSLHPDIMWHGFANNVYMGENPEFKSTFV